MVHFLLPSISVKYNKSLGMYTADANVNGELEDSQEDHFYDLLCWPEVQILLS